MKQLLYAAVINVLKEPELSDSLPEPRIIAEKLVAKAKEGDTQAIALLIQIAEFEPKEQ